MLPDLNSCAYLPRYGIFAQATVQRDRIERADASSELLVDAGLPCNEQRAEYKKKK